MRKGLTEFIGCHDVMAKQAETKHTAYMQRTARCVCVPCLPASILTCISRLK